jgi:GAF domain-containing protein
MPLSARGDPMKRRFRAGGVTIKGRRHKAPEPKRRNAPKAVRGRGSSDATDETEVARLTRERDEALEQQIATSEVLQVISGSPGDPQPVFEAILTKAVRICDAKFGNIHRRDGNAFYLVATHNTPPALAEARRRLPLLASPQTAQGRLVATKTAIHITDLAADSNYIEARHPLYVTAVELGGVRTLLIVPMLKEDELIGSFAVYRQEVRPFTEKQIALVTNFAAQAVIAIENARLLNELRQRTTDLAEALEQQRATSDLLQVISGSPGNLEPVFQAMLENAVGICGANFGNMFLYEDDAFRTVAMFNAPEAYVNARTRAPFHPPSESGLGRLAATKEVVQIADLRTEGRYTINRDPFVVAGVELAGIRTLFAVPMLKEGSLVGGIVIYRQEVRPFSEKQIELVKNFANQVVIAIENARLLNELRQSTTDLTERSADLTEALEQQTATSEVLQVISSSSGILEPVFATMLEKAVRICDAKFGNIYRWDGEALHIVATHNTPPAFAEDRRRSPYRPYPKSPIGQMLAAKTVVHVNDVTTEEVYLAQHDPVAVSAVALGGTRTLLGVPLLNKGEMIGAFFLSRQEVRPFSEKQIALVKNFAAQAVVAIENARLLNELRERTGQLEVQSNEVVKLNQQLEQRVADQVGEIERMGRLRRFLPPQVADLIVASGTEKQLESHRREITALFCDLRGFTGFSESADPEDVMALLRDYHAAIGEVIIKYSGTLERYAGDGVMVVFNDPVPVDNPALQAVLMALEMRDAIGALTEKWRRLGHDIGFGIGIAHGFATLGTIGFEGRFDYAAIGTVSNVASRLCDEAKPGQILISPRVLMAVEDAVTVEPVGEFALKGIRRPLAAFNVVTTV